MDRPIEPNDEDSAELEPWLDWPACPQCGKRRQARCPVCDLAGDDFPLADYQELGVEASATLDRDVAPPAPSSDPVLLMCLRCDEAFRPRFYHRCAACGFEFRDGVRPRSSLGDDWTSRAVWLTFAMFAVLGAVLLYFWVILRV